MFRRRDRDAAASPPVVDIALLLEPYCVADDDPIDAVSRPWPLETEFERATGVDR
jgi:hypothetical protein